MKHITAKLITLLLVFAMILPFALIGCAKEETPADSETDSTPVVTAPAAKVALDLTKEWEAINGANTLVQGCLVINTKFAQEHPNEVAKFLEDYKASVETVKSGSDEAIGMIVNAGILPKAAIAKKALPKCNICYIAGADMQPVMKVFCEKLFALNPASVGAVPNDGFYYTAP